MLTSGGHTAAVIQARMNSSRLPGKVLLDAVGKPMLELMIERVQRVPSLDRIIVATTENASDDLVVALAERLGVGAYRGSEDDVLGRVLEAARAQGAEVIVELTGDCPLIDPEIIEHCIEAYRAGGVDFVPNAITHSFPVGMDVNIYATEVLADVARRTDDPLYHEHVSLFIHQNPDIYSLKGVAAPAEFTRPEIELTLDEADDYRLISEIFDALYPENPTFNLRDVLDLLDRRPDLSTINRDVRRRSV